MIEVFENVLAASDLERRHLFLAAANRLGTAERNIEKDFWVCWTPDALFNGLESGGPRLLFKGGTSLSKGYGLIQRFFEDIDIAVFREDIGQRVSRPYYDVPPAAGLRGGELGADAHEDMLDFLRCAYEAMAGMILASIPHFAEVVASIRDSSTAGTIRPESRRASHGLTGLRVGSLGGRDGVRLPQSVPPRRLMVVGLYRYVGNPLYRGFSVGGIGLWVVFGPSPVPRAQFVIALGVDQFVLLIRALNRKKRRYVDSGA